MKLIYGSYGALEGALKEVVAGIKQNPLEKVLVLTPSSRLSRYLQIFLTENYGSTANISFMKFSALSAKIDAEFTAPNTKKLLSAQHLQNFILKNIVGENGLVKRVYISALKSTLRDMADALIVPATLKEHAAEGAFGAKEDNEYMSALADTYERYQRALSSVPGMRSYKEYFESVVENIPASKFLSSFKAVIFYGFYDFTGTQLEIFNAVRQNYKTIMFFPYRKTQAYKFTSKFFESNILGMSKETVELEPAPGVLGAAEDALFNHLISGEAENKNIRIISASGVNGELFAAAKTILELTENNGYKFSEIALCARVLEPYKNNLINIFEQNKIPLNTSLEFGLLSHPLGIFCFNLLNLAHNGFYREDVLSVIKSQYFAVKNNWRALAQNSLVERGLEQWENLINKKDPAYDSSFLSFLTNLGTQLGFFNKPYPWDVLSKHAVKILEDFVDANILTEGEKTVFNTIVDTIIQINQFSLVRESAKEKEFLEELNEALKEQSVGKVQNSELGVTAGDVMGLRGQHFKVVILLGVNEKVFPQIVREDPLLRDKFRRTLRDVQGFWIGQKLDRFEEEKLFYYFTLSSAREKLFLSFQRSDEEGKAVVPSLYLTEVCRAAGIELEKNITNISRRELEKYFQTPQEFLNSKEMLTKIFSFPSVEENIKAAGFDWDALASYYNAAKAMSARSSLGAYDGIVNYGDEIFSSLSKKGFSASALQNLAECPMRFFFIKALGLDEEADILKRDAIASNIKGTIYHKILQRVYTEIDREISMDSALAALEKIMALEMSFERYKEFGLYPVVWQVITEKMAAALQEFVKKDVESMEGFAPVMFEAAAAAKHDFAGEEIKLHGYIDRIDRRGKEYRIIDYKTSQRSVKDLKKVIFNKKYLQPVIYWILASALKEFEEMNNTSFSFLNIEDGYFRRELTSAEFDLIKDKFDNFIKLLTGFIKHGKFFINEGENNCKYCTFANVCRKGSAASLMRSRSSDFYKELEGFKDD
ncbi:ATP-dependent nuclease subunit B-like protein [Elusimicrobium minutum Pei191]|uniref:ATP-dependent nuclease subunit B-like protein n=1 Tax=Elusimicrobium minutum (strain Pei191) TaxID=445932 RepID=B2KE91_ELUMP|nr:PD-(D/E)XK nuclease family protein [Elusimicrobium minutum]ACC98837.1 ATP-dependent nuclease subunit B-like protein [Elusimicrobium minutum Pei191]